MQTVPMFLAKVEGSVVATMKDAHVAGRKLPLLRPQSVDERDPKQFRPGVVALTRTVQTKEFYGPSDT